MYKHKNMQTLHAHTHTPNRLERVNKTQLCVVKSGTKVKQSDGRAITAELLTLLTPEAKRTFRICFIKKPSARPAHRELKGTASPAWT